jgi:sugar/nucleoside kinase (ribokinase family)
MHREVVVIGPLNVDLLITGTAPQDMDSLRTWAGLSEVTLCAAGSAGYIAQDLTKLGLKTGVVSTLADDPFGDALLRILSEVGLDVLQVNREAGTLTGIGIYMLLFGSKKRPLTYRYPTHAPWPKQFSPDLEQYILGHKHLHSAGYLHFPEMYTDEMGRLFRKAKEAGLSTSLDPQFPLVPINFPWVDPLINILPSTDILLLDEDEARQITQEKDLHNACKVLRGLGPGIVAIKRGGYGSLLFDGGKFIEQSAYPVPEAEIVESIGAGDAFDTGMIYGNLKGFDLRKSARFATLAAASTLRGSGGTMTLASHQVLEEQERTLRWQD